MQEEIIKQLINEMSFTQRTKDMQEAIIISPEEIMQALKYMPLTLNEERDSNGVLLQVKEFPEAYDYAGNKEECLKILAHSLKDWAKVLSDDVDSWRVGRESEVPYLLKILSTSEEELLTCLRNSRCESI